MEGVDTELVRLFRRPPANITTGQLGLTEEERMTVEDSSHQDDVVAAAEEVAREGQARHHGGMLLDLTTAQAIITVAKELEPDNLDRLRAMNLRRAAQVCMRLVSA